MNNGEGSLPARQTHCVKSSLELAAAWHDSQRDMRAAGAIVRGSQGVTWHTPASQQQAQHRQKCRRDTNNQELQGEIHHAMHTSAENATIVQMRKACDREGPHAPNQHAAQRAHNTPPWRLAWQTCPAARACSSWRRRRSARCLSDGTSNSGKASESWRRKCAARVKKLPKSGARQTAHGRPQPHDTRCQGKHTKTQATPRASNIDEQAGKSHKRAHQQDSRRSPQREKARTCPAGRARSEWTPAAWPSNRRRCAENPTAEACRSRRRTGDESGTRVWEGGDQQSSAARVQRTRGTKQRIKKAGSRRSDARATQWRSRGHDRQRKTARVGSERTNPP